MLSDANNVRPVTDKPNDFRQLWAAWPHAGVLLCLLVAWVLLFHFQGNSELGYYPSSSLFRWWRAALQAIQDQEHAYVMPGVTVGLLWWKREELAALPKQVWWPALLLFLLAIAAHLAGFLVQQTRLSVVAFCAGLYVLSGLVWGKVWLRAVLFPFGLLLFSVPLGTSVEPVTLPLRLMATKITAWLCQGVLGINVVQTGNYLFSPTGAYEYEVAAPCSGIKSLTTIMAFAVIYGYLNLNSFWRRLFLIALAAPLAVAANICRLTMIVVTAETWGQQAGHRIHDNQWLSLIPYIPAFVGVGLAAYWLREDRKAAAKTVRSEPVLMAEAGQKP
jgi:exosortase